MSTRLSPAFDGCEADHVYAAESAAALAASPRRFARFAHIVGYIESITSSEWWDEEFPFAPVEVEVQRRSRGASASLATIAANRVGVIALVDGTGWGLETVLHELAHLAAGTQAGHGVHFRAALVRLWRHEAGIDACRALQEALGP